MASKTKTKYGEINIENDVIARIAGLAAVDCYGIVGMAAKNMKDGFFQLLKKESLAKGINVSVEDGMVSVGLHIIVQYGTNIPVICESLISAVLYNVEEFTGLPVKAINVNVVGIHAERER